ncbi:MAG: dihydroneopterin aldolase [Acidobacteriota bacterium]
MEFLNFVLILVAGYLVVKKPHREKTAFTLLVVIFLLLIALFFVGSRSSILPPVNY